MRHIKTPALKREVKRKMWELVMTAQEDDEQLQMQNISVLTWLVDPTAADCHSLKHEMFEIFDKITGELDRRFSGNEPFLLKSLLHY